MKKLILSALVVGSLLATSCKDAKKVGGDLTDTVTNTADKATDLVKDGADAAKDGANAVVDEAAGAVESAVAGVTIPDFKDPKVKEYVVEYVAYAKEYIAGGANVATNSDLMKKGTDLAAKSSEIMKALGTDADEVQKFSKVMTAIASKMAPAQ